MSSSSQILDALTAEKARDWVEIGKTLDALEKLSSVTQDGQSWQTVLRGRLSDLGQQISVGHLNKVRRAYSFLKDAIGQLELPDERMVGAPISALEVAEKLSQLDRELGLQAAADILRTTDPATYLEINERYTKYLAEQPEKMTPRQAAWRRRKTAVPLPKDADPNLAERDETDRLADTIGDLIKNHIRSELNESLLEIKRLEHEISSRDQRIARLEADERYLSEAVRTAQKTVIHLRTQLSHLKNKPSDAT